MQVPRCFNCPFTQLGPVISIAWTIVGGFIGHYSFRFVTILLRGRILSPSGGALVDLLGNPYDSRNCCKCYMPCLVRIKL